MRRQSGTSKQSEILYRRYHLLHDYILCTVDMCHIPYNPLHEPSISLYSGDAKAGAEKRAFRTKRSEECAFRKQRVFRRGFICRITAFFAQKEVKFFFVPSSLLFPQKSKENFQKPLTSRGGSVIIICTILGVWPKLPPESAKNKEVSV